MVVTTKKIYCDLCGKEITNELDFITYSIRVRLSIDQKEKYLDAHRKCIKILYDRAHERESIDG